MLDQLAPNKVNMPPQLKSHPQKKSAKVTRKLISPRSNWKIEDLEEAMETIEKGCTSLRKASRYWNIPLTSLPNHLTNKTMSSKRDPPGVLSTNEETTIVEMGIWHVGMWPINLLTSIETQNGKINTNPCNTVQEWHMLNLMVALV
jgi:hypothetical protein